MSRSYDILHRKIKEEIEKVGGKVQEARLEEVIRNFESLYEELKEQQRLPQPGEIPEEQYNLFVKYMEESGVLAANGEVDGEALAKYDCQRNLRILYEELKEQQRLPQPGEIPEEQYNAFVKCMEERGILTADGKVDIKRLRRLERLEKGLQRLEKFLKKIEENPPRRPPYTPREVVRRGGGVSPCTHVRVSSGGIAPCRFPEGYVQTGHVQTSKDRISPCP